jgi:hypothetical protein
VIYIDDYKIIVQKIDSTSRLNPGKIRYNT